MVNEDKVFAFALCLCFVRFAFAVITVALLWSRIVTACRPQSRGISGEHEVEKYLYLNVLDGHNGAGEVHV